MEVTIDWPTGVINVPRTGMTLVQSVPTEIRELNVNEFRLELKNQEDSVQGMVWTKTHNHNTEVSLAGVTYARIIEILDPYTITFEDGQYAVNLTGGNNNIGDKTNVNQVSVRTNNSAGLISSPDIEFSSFNGGVMINVNTGVAGTLYPTGTERRKSNNMADAYLIATYRGFRRFYLDSDITLESTATIDDFELVGHSHVDTQLTISGSAEVYRTIIRDCHVNGVLDGGNEITNCIIENLQFFNGHIHNSGLYGSITLDGDLPAHIGNCSQVRFDVTPIIDMGGWGQDLMMTDYSGKIMITNLTGDTGSTLSTQAVIGVDQGQVVLDSNTLLVGEVRVFGVGELVDENGNEILSGIWNSGVTYSGVTIVNRTINTTTIADSVWDEQLSNHLISGSTGEALNQAKDSSSLTLQSVIDGVWNAQLSNYQISGSTGNALSYTKYNDAVHIDINNGSSGTTYPIGTVTNPVNNLADAKTIASRIGTLKLCFHSNYTVTSGETISGYKIYSINHSTIVINPGALTMYTNFEYLELAGNLSGYTIINNCSISSSGITGFYGMMENVTFNGDIAVISDNTKNAVLIDCFLGNVTTPPSFDCGGDGAKVSFRGLTGAFLFVNKTGSTQKIFIDLYSARIGFDSTVTAGEITVRGIGYIYQDDSTNTTFDLQGLISKSTISVAVWDEVLNASTHNLPLSAGRRLRALSLAVITEGTVVSGTTNTVTLNGNASTTDGAYDPAAISITEGTGAGQSRLILQYDGSERTAIIDRDWKVIPDDTSNYIISANVGREHVNEGLAQGGTINTITLNTLASPFDNAYVGQVVFIRSGTGEDQALRVIEYNGTTKVATMCENWQQAPDNTSGYVMLPSSVLKESYIANSVWDEPVLNHTTDGTYGAELATQDDLQAIQESFSYILKADSGITVTLGSIGSGDYTDTLTHDNVYLEIVETTTGFQVDFTFDVIPDQVPRTFQFQGRYEGNPAHNVNVYAYNHETTSYELITAGGSSQLEHSTTDYLKEFTLNANHVNPTTNQITIRIIHSSPGQITNRLWVDKVNVITSVTAPSLTLQEIVDGVWDEPLSGHTVLTSAGSRIQTLSDITTATVISGTTTSITTDLTESRDDFYVGQIVRFTDGNLQNYTRVVTGYDGTTKTLTFSEAMIETPNSGSTFNTIATYAVSPYDVANEVWSFPLP